VTLSYKHYHTTTLEPFHPFFLFILRRNRNQRPGHIYIYVCNECMSFSLSWLRASCQHIAPLHPPNIFPSRGHGPAHARGGRRGGRGPPCSYSCSHLCCSVRNSPHYRSVRHLLLSDIFQILSSQLKKQIVEHGAYSTHEWLDEGNAMHGRPCNAHGGSQARGSSAHGNSILVMTIYQERREPGGPRTSAIERTEDGGMGEKHME
jgi:hypothetical protein